MSNTQKIGFFLTDTKIVIAESNRNKLEKIVSSPLVLSAASPQEPPLQADISDEVQMVGFFQKILRENKIDLGQVYVSLPIKEVFLRSFVVPFMPSGELNNVVFYEAKKYVPFDLKLLDYLYEAVPFVENKQKRLRIIFYAVRKQTLEKYGRIFKQLGCKPIVYESSLVSLAKQLIANNYMRLDQKMVVVYVHEDYGQIIFYEKGIACFVREFPLSVTEVHDAKAGVEVLRLQLIREIRKSFGYYSRQFSQEKIKEILVISNMQDKDLVNGFSEELSVKAKVVESSVSIGIQTLSGIEVMCACGACLTKGPSGIYNFLQARSVPQLPEAGKGIMPVYVTQLMTWNIGEFLYALHATSVCVLLLGGAFAFTRLELQKMKTHDDMLTKNRADLVSKSIDQLQVEIKSNSDKLQNYKRILQPTPMASLLASLVNSLPQGVWLNDTKVQYFDRKRISIELTGGVYLKDVGRQFKAVQEFLSNLRSNPFFSSVNFKINTMEKKTVNGFETVAFSISGS